MRESIASEIADVKTTKKSGIKETLIHIFHPNKQRDEAYKSILPNLLVIVENEGLDDILLEKYIFTITPKELLQKDRWRFFHAIQYVFFVQKPNLDTSIIEQYLKQQEKKGGTIQQQKDNKKLKQYIEDIQIIEKNIIKSLESDDMQQYLKIKEFDEQQLPQDPKFLNTINIDIVSNLARLKTTTKAILAIFQKTWGNSYKKRLQENN